jgi:Rho guanine nucleotide exchange factor 10
VFVRPDEMIYDDVENGGEGGNSSLEYGWSSSEFESYEEQSDSECKNGIPRSFLRGSHKKQVSVLSTCRASAPITWEWGWEARF